MWDVENRKEQLYVGKDPARTLFVVNLALQFSSLPLQVAVIYWDISLQL